MVRKITFIGLFIILNSLCNAQELTTFVLVRHAEKAADGTRNPPLNELGMERSKNLASLLGNQQITALYATPFKRTQETLRPIADQTKLTIQSYDPYAKGEWLATLLDKHSGGTVVIAGHSNTIPLLANALLGDDTFAQFDEKDYSNLIIIVTDKIGEGKLVRLKF